MALSCAVLSWLTTIREIDYTGAEKMEVHSFVMERPDFVRSLQFIRSMMLGFREADIVVRQRIFALSGECLEGEAG